MKEKEVKNVVDIEEDKNMKLGWGLFTREVEEEVG